MAERESHIIECMPSHVACGDEIECLDIVMVIISENMVTYVRILVSVDFGHTMITYEWKKGLPDVQRS